MTELASPQRPSTEPPSPRSPGTSVQQYLDNDARPVPAVLRYDINDNLGTAPLDVTRYISREYHDLEVEKVWRRVWQFVCREDHIPNPGDHITYDIADDKLIIMRQPDGSIKALYNVCLHRGRALRQEGGKVSELRCPFHGFSWNIDGSMKHLPCAWDFPEVDPTNFPLPEAKVAIVERVRLHQPGPERRAARGLPRVHAQRLGALGLHRPRRLLALRRRRQLQLEGGRGGLHRGLPLPGHAPADDGVARRREHAVRRHQGRELEPADRAAGRAQPDDREPHQRAGGARLLLRDARLLHAGQGSRPRGRRRRHPAGAVGLHGPP